MIMKAERRHELKENDLEHALKQGMKYLDDNGKQISIALIVVVVVVGAIFLGVRSKAAALESVWRRKAELRFDDLEVGKTSLASLASMTGEVSDPQFVMYSLIEQGQHALRLSQQVPFPPDAELTAKARIAYEQLLTRFENNLLAVGLGHLGLATVEENEFVKDQNPNHKSRAITHMQAVANNSALTGFPLQNLASRRLERVEQTFTTVVFVSPPVPAELLEPAKKGNEAGQ